MTLPQVKKSISCCLSHQNPPTYLFRAVLDCFCLEMVLGLSIFISWGYFFLDSHSDGTHSLQRIHCWASDLLLHFSKSDEKTNSSTSWMIWGRVHFHFGNYYFKSIYNYLRSEMMQDILYTSIKLPKKLKHLCLNQFQIHTNWVRTIYLFSFECLLFFWTPLKGIYFRFYIYNYLILMKHL